MATLHLSKQNTTAPVMPKTLPFSKVYEGRTGYLYEGSKVTPIKKINTHSCIDLRTGRDVIPLPWNRVHLVKGIDGSTV